MASGLCRFRALLHLLAQGRVQLDFRAADLGGAPARARKRTTIKRDRALLLVSGKNVAAARALLEHVARKETS